MFYCNACALEKNLAIEEDSKNRSFGPCEFCGETSNCTDLKLPYARDKWAIVVPDGLKRDIEKQNKSLALNSYIDLRIYLNQAKREGLYIGIELNLNLQNQMGIIFCPLCSKENPGVSYDVAHIIKNICDACLRTLIIPSIRSMELEFEVHK